MRVFSFGGGIQSTAVLVLTAQGKLAYDAFLFAHVGEDSENPDTLAYLAEHAAPYAQAHGITLHTLRRVRRDGSHDTLLDYVSRAQRSIHLPVWFKSGSYGRRSCTREFKRAVIAKWLRRHGATPDIPATMGLGISSDEFHRARTDSGFAYIVPEYPLLDLNLNRRDCIRIVADAGLPVPPKSACWFCPFKTPRDWQDLRRSHPILFAAALQLEEMLIARRAHLGRDPAYLHVHRRPLAEATAYEQLDLPDPMVCESGHCMT